jgi:biopolymer transport protein ExbD
MSDDLLWPERTIILFDHAKLSIVVTELVPVIDINFIILYIFLVMKCSLRIGLINCSMSKA